MATRYNDIPSLVKRIDDLERRLREQETAPRLQASSIDLGDLVIGESANIVVQNAEGETVQRIGRQEDGTFASLVVPTASAPIPPAPSSAMLQPKPGGLNIIWDGQFSEGSSAPADFDQVLVHVSTTAGFVPTDATVVSSFSRPQRFEIFIPLTPELQYVKLVTKSQQDALSAPSGEVSATPDPLVDTSGIEEMLAAKTSIYRSTSDAPNPAPDPTQYTANDLWWKLDGNGNVVKQWAWSDQSNSWVVQAPSGLLIAAETISAMQLAADSVTANKLLSGSITTEKLGALAVTAEKIASQSITADKLTSTLVLGTKIVAGTQAGSRVELGTFGLRKYAPNGTTVQVDFTGDEAIFSGKVTGAEIIGSRLLTAASGTRLEISSYGSSSDDYGRVAFYRSTDDEYSEAWGEFALRTNISGVIGSANFDSVTIRAGKQNGSDYRKSGRLQLMQRLDSSLTTPTASVLYASFNEIDLRTQASVAATSGNAKPFGGSIGFTTAAIGGGVFPSHGSLEGGANADVVYRVYTATQRNQFVQALAESTRANGGFPTDQAGRSIVVTVTGTGRTYLCSWYYNTPTDTITYTYRRIDPPADTGWNSLALANSWTSYSASYPAMWRASDGRVQLTGLITRAAAPSGNTAFASSLGADYMPDGGQSAWIFNVAAGDNPTTNVAQIRVTPTGINYYTGSYTPWISLSEISWPLPTSSSVRA